MIPSRPALIAAGLLALVFALPSEAPAAATAGDWAVLPNITGRWIVSPAANPLPSYKPAWAAKQRQAAAQARAGKLADPAKACGLPFGNPWMLGVSDIHEWIVRPDGVWHNIENTGVTSRIYTDGRPHLAGDDIFPSYTGDSIGRWEGDTLVANTTSFQDDTWMGPGALIHSDKLTLTQRIRLTAPDQLEVKVTAEDPVAFTRPWQIVYRYRRAPADTIIHEYACKILRTAKD